MASSLIYGLLLISAIAVFVAAQDGAADAAADAAVGASADNAALLDAIDAATGADAAAPPSGMLARVGAWFMAIPGLGQLIALLAKMQSFILVGCLAVLASAASLSKDEFDRLESTYNLTAFVGPNYNLTVAVDILVEEARTVGVTTEQHLKTCIALDREMSKFNHAWAEFKLKGASLHFESVDQIMPVLKKETPKIHTALNEFRPVYKSMMTGVDENAAAFMEQLKNTAVQTFLDYYNVKEEDKTLRLREQVSLFGKAVTKIFDSYEALPIESKNSIDRETCSRTIDRIMRTEDRSLVDELRMDIERKLRDAKKIEEIENYLEMLESFRLVSFGM